jgi:uncharacterized membrane protein YqjE
MPRRTDGQPDFGTGTASEASGQEPGLLEAAGLLGRELGAMVHDHLFLAALETRQAGESLVRIIAMGVIVACLLLTAWLALAGAAVIMLVQHSLVTAGTALVLVFAIHCLLAMALVAAIRRRSRCLMFPATISRLEPASCSDPDAKRGR